MHTAKFRQGHGLDFRGIHHRGVPVEDVESSMQKFEKLGAKCFAKRPEGAQGLDETKFQGPDGVIFDITDHPRAGTAPLDAENTTTVAPLEKAMP